MSHVILHSFVGTAEWIAIEQAAVERGGLWRRPIVERVSDMDATFNTAIIDKRLLDLDACSRFCGRWRLLFHYHVPPILRLRLFQIEELSTTHTYMRPGTKVAKVLKKEISSFKSYIFGESDVSTPGSTHAEWDLFNKNPEFCATRIALTLYSKGYHPDFLHNLQVAWQIALPYFCGQQKDNPKHLDTINSYFDRDGFSFDHFYEAHPRRNIEVYGHSANKQVSYQSTDVSIVGIRNNYIPDEVMVHLKNIPKKVDGDSKYFIRVSICARDTHGAFDMYLRAIQESEDLHSILSDNGKRKDYARAHQAAHPPIILIDRGDIKAYHLSERLRFDSKLLEIFSDVDGAIQELDSNTTNIDASKRGKKPPTLVSNILSGKEIFRNSKSFSALTRCYSRAVDLVGKKSSSEEIFQALSIGMDSTILPLTSIRDPFSEFKQSNIPGIGAKMLALDTPRILFKHLEIAVSNYLRWKNMKMKSISMMNKINFYHLDLSIREYIKLDEDIQSSHIHIIARTISEFFKNPPRYIEKFAHNYYYDLSRCLYCRNQLVHMSDDVTNSYLAHSILTLYRFIFQFRLSVDRIRPNISLKYPTKNLNSNDAVFGLLARMMVSDYEALTVPSIHDDASNSPESLIRFGWRSWSANGCQSLLESIKYSESEVDKMIKIADDKLSSFGPGGNINPICHIDLHENHPFA